MKYKLIYLFIFVIILISSSSTGFIVIRNIDYNKPILHNEVIKSDRNSLESAIIRNVALIDKNSDKIADDISIESSNDFILLFKNFEGANKFIPSGVQLIKKYSSIPAIQIKGDFDTVRKFTSLSDLAIIEPNYIAHEYLAYSTAQIDARNGAWARGFTGSPDFSVAILDSGIDFTHNAFNGRIRASYNAFDNNATLAKDGNEHGTHVAGIVAGLFDANNTFTQTSRGTLPSDGYFTPDILLANVNTTTSIRVGIDWGEKGADSPGGTVGVVLVDASDISSLACSSCIDYDTSGMLETTFTGIPPGDYYVGFYNKAGASNVDYEGWAELTPDNQLPEMKHKDGFPLYAGVAYSTNIVAVKVLDDSGSGGLNVILNGIDWVINHKTDYNITVVNLSLGLSGEISATLDSAMASLANAGIIPVVAAGNDGADSGGIFSPGSAPEAITVGALNRYNEIAYYSSVGDSSVNSVVKPDVLAPGGSYATPSTGWDSGYTEGLGLIVSADSNYVGFNNEANDMLGLQGTSMASPHVAGIAAILSQRYAELYGWSWNIDVVHRIKRAILAGTFEVANIGSNGGESKPGEITDHTPTINRSAKDYQEGWGAVSTSAALGALADPFPFGYQTLNFALEDPFAPKVYAWTLMAEAGKTYNFQADVPEGADIDLLVFDANSGSYGEPTLLYSSTTSSTSDSSNDEAISINVDTDKELIVEVRLVNSLNTQDTVIVNLIDPNFVPYINVHFPTNNTVVGENLIKLDFDSATRIVDLYIDNNYLGKYQSGDIVDSLTEGYHNFTLVEENPSLNLTAKVYINVGIDLTNPVLIENYNLISINDTYRFIVNGTDNMALAGLRVIVDDRIANQTQINGGTSANFISVDLNPRYFEFGMHNVTLELFDQAGNFDSTTFNSVLFNHSIYLIPQDNIIFEYGSTVYISAKAGIQYSNPTTYQIILNGNTVIDSSWDGNNIYYELPGDLGIYNYSIILNSDSETLIYNGSIIVHDTISPKIQAPPSGSYDITTDLDFDFSISELLPDTLMIYKNDNILSIKHVWTDSDTKLTLTGNFGDTDVIKIFANDTSGNNATEVIIIDWDDLTAPTINPVDTKEINQGSATEPIVITWTEAYLHSVNVTMNSESLFYSLDPNVSSYTISVDKLNSLSPGKYTVKVIVTDVAGNSAKMLFQIEIIETSTTSSTENTTTETSSAAFLYFNFIWFSMPIISIIYYKKHNSRT